MTHGAFIDESEKNTSHYFLGAFVITQASYTPFVTTMSQIHAQVLHDFPELPHDFEFHGWEFMGGKDHWRQVPLRYRFGIMNKILDCVAASGGCVHIEGVDRAKHAARNYRYEYPAREVAFSYLLEKIDRCSVAAVKVNNDSQLTEIFADEHHTKAESTSNFTNYQNYGTWGYKSSLLENLHPDLKFIDSRSTLALQAIDCVTYIYNRVMTHQETNARAQAAKDDFWRRMQPMFSGCGTHRIWP